MSTNRVLSMIVLRLTTPGQPERTVELVARRTTIGRSPRSDLPLEDRFASRIHAELRVDDDGCQVNDLGSSNGTFVNDAAIEDTRRLRVGDKVRIGRTTIEVVDEPPGPSPSSGTLIHRLPVEGSRAFQGLDSVLARVEQAAGTETTVARRHDLFEVVSQVSVALLSTASLDEVLQQLLDLIFEAVPVERAFLLLQNEEGTLDLEAASTRPAQADPVAPSISREIKHRVLALGEAVLTTDAQQDERFRDRDSVILSGVRGILAVPLAVDGRTLGLIYADSPLASSFLTEEHMRLLTTVASVAAIKIENALLVEARIEGERLREQLESARQIQHRLLPGRPPEMEGYELSGASFPCYEVGGDYFDFVSLRGSRTVVAIGDVSGKGLDAALLMSSLHAAVRTMSESGISIRELVAEMNRYLVATTPYNRFATLFCGLLDGERHVLDFVNAGHNPPWLIRPDGRITELLDGGMPVGLDPTAEYREGRVEVGPGDVIFGYSDGVTEARDASGEELGEERLLAAATNHRELGAARLRDRVEEEVSRFMGAATPIDDMTLLVAKRMP